MSGKNRSPAIVIAYLMKSKGWRFAQSYQWVKERRPSVDLTQAVYQQLVEFEQKFYGSVENIGCTVPSFTPGVPSFSFGFPKPNDPVLVPAFNNAGASSMFARPAFEAPPQDFIFGAGQTQKSTSDSHYTHPSEMSNNDIAMGGGS